MSAYLYSEVNKVTTNILQRLRNEGEKIAMLTAYDYSTAKLLLWSWPQYTACVTPASLMARNRPLS